MYRYTVVGLPVGVGLSLASLGLIARWPASGYLFALLALLADVVLVFTYRPLEKGRWLFFGGLLVAAVLNILLQSSLPGFLGVMMILAMVVKRRHVSVRG